MLDQVTEVTGDKASGSAEIDGVDMNGLARAGRSVERKIRRRRCCACIRKQTVKSA